MTVPPSCQALALLFASCLAAAESAPDVAVAAGWDDLPAARGGADDWPWWRGPTLDNHAAPGQDAPLTWSESEHVLWRTALPGAGHGTPCICGARIFLPAADKAGGVIWVLCLDRASGRKLWQTEVYHGPLPKIHGDNTHASSSIACDGERLFYPYQTPSELRLASLDTEGRVVWDRLVGPYTCNHGHAASPAIYRSAVILATDGKEERKLTALHRRTGAVIWRVPRPVEGIETYSSPLVLSLAGRDQAIILGVERTCSYDPASGRLLWECRGPASTCAAVVAVHGDTVFASGGWPQRSLLAIRADGAGDVTATRLLWKDDQDKKATYVPSPLVADGLLYVISDTGLARCYDPAAGRILWENDLKAPFYSSPVLMDGRIYDFDRKGKGYVLKAGRQFELLAANELAAGACATPVILGGRIYLRSLKDFYCLGAK